jgi:hypothetical protein
MADFVVKAVKMAVVYVVFVLESKCERGYAIGLFEPSGMGDAAYFDRGYLAFGIAVYRHFVTMVCL